MKEEFKPNYGVYVPYVRAQYIFPESFTFYDRIKAEAIIKAETKAIQETIKNFYK